MVKLSKTSKLGTYSWSLQARETCPGSVDTNGETVPACAGCYATFGNYAFPNVKKVRADNRQQWQHPDFVTDMISALRHERYFRLFDSGDFYHAELVQKWFAICEALPDTQFWIPTRSHKVAKLALWIHKLSALPNVTVRYSADSIDGTFDAALHGSVIYSCNSQLDIRDVSGGMVYIDARLMTLERAEWELFGTDWHRSFPAKVREQQMLRDNAIASLPRAGAAAAPQQQQATPAGASVVAAEGAEA